MPLSHRTKQPRPIFAAILDYSYVHCPSNNYTLAKWLDGDASLSRVVTVIRSSEVWHCTVHFLTLLVMKFAHYITTLERDAPKEWKGKFLQYVSKVVVHVGVVNVLHRDHLLCLCL